MKRKIQLHDGILDLLRRWGVYPLESNGMKNYGMDFVSSHSCSGGLEDCECGVQSYE